MIGQEAVVVWGYFPSISPLQERALTWILKEIGRECGKV
jgi:hypothetical protein